VEGINFRNQNFNSRYNLTGQERRNFNPAFRGQYAEENNSQTIAKAGILQLCAIFLTKASEWCGNKLMQGKEFTTSENVKKIAGTMLTDNNLNKKVNVEFIDNKNISSIANTIKTNSGIDITKELLTVARGENAFYMDSIKVAVAPKSKPSLILHELGHAITAHKGKFMRFLQKSRMYAPTIPTALIFINKMLPRRQGEETFIEKHAGKIGFCAFLPTIIEEGLASLRGIKAANKVKKSIAMNLKPLKRNYAFAWLTYVIAGLGLGIAAKQSILENKTSKS